MTLETLKTLRESADKPFKLIIAETGTKHLKSEADVYFHEKERHHSRSTRPINKGLESFDTEYITFFSNDVYLPHGFLGAMEKCFEVAPDCGAATLGTTEHRDVEQSLVREANYWPVAMLSRKCVADVGLFDEAIPGVWNDTDYLLRMYEKGYRMYKNLSKTLHHLVGQTHIKHDSDHLAIYQKNKKYFEEKHKNTKQAVLYFELLTGVQGLRDLKEIRI